ncbi:MAG: hypothetical protein Ta2F_11170 [Termitinemataceae bacterium]|nr:MAG: hypothetical protein Ta2F_11170 [Termitinemataceae bacterium]
MEDVLGFLKIFGLESGVFSLALFWLVFFKPLKEEVDTIKGNHLKHLKDQNMAIGNAVHAILLKMDIRHL